MRKNSASDTKLKEILSSALIKFYEQDKLLVERKGMEQACVFRIGLYINELLKQDEQLKELDLDCEYNKNMFKSKSTPSFKKGTRPDLIIHQRNEVKNNFIIEFKGWWNKKTLRDIKKLEDFTDPCKGYHYQLGVFVVLTKNFKDLKLRFFKNGQEIIENDL